VCKIGFSIGESERDICQYAWMISQYLHYAVLTYEIKPVPKMIAQNLHCVKCIFFLPPKLPVSPFVALYFFMNAVITPRKTNVSPKIITYTLPMMEFSGCYYTSDPTPSFIY